MYYIWGVIVNYILKWVNKNCFFYIIVFSRVFFFGKVENRIKDLELSEIRAILILNKD